jgi:ubiquinone/menaquinone biosynthesis C-methylase UbiE
MSELKFSGERFLPERLLGDIELEHYHRYLLSAEIVSNKVVLDIACGTGYGSDILASMALRVIGVDIAEEAISFAKSRYQKSNLEFLLGSCADIPVEDSSVDVVISFETIEHHDEHQNMMKEIKRVLKPGGFLVISTPDKYEYSVRSNYKNAFHIKELYRGEFHELLSSFFKEVNTYSQSIAFGSVVLSEGAQAISKSYSYDDNGRIKSYEGVPSALYIIAVASDLTPPLLFNGLFAANLQQADSFRELYEHSVRIEGAVVMLQDTVKSLVEERDAYVMLQDTVKSLVEERDAYKQAVRNLGGKVED